MRHVLVNDTGGREVGEKMTKCDMGRGGLLKNVILRVMYFLNDPFQDLKLIYLDNKCSSISKFISVDN